MADIRDNKLKATALLNDRIKVEFEKNEAFSYSGNELRPSVNVYYNRHRFDPIQMNEGSDYTLSYADNTNAGTATITLTGIGNFSGTKDVTFTIEPKKIDSPTFSRLKSEYTYTGQAIEPEFTLMDGDTVIPSSEYEVIYSDNTEVGTATVTIKDASGGNYEVNCKAEFDIVKIDTVINELPVADAVSYDPNKTLGAINLSGGNVLDSLGKNVPGSWSWADTSVVPTVDNSGYEVVFTPDDQEHYNSVKGTIKLNVAKADIKIFELPVAGGITYGDDLAKSVIVGGLALLDGGIEIVVSGTFSWKDDSIKPFASDSDKTLYTIVFTPYDTVNYNTAEAEITVNVSRAAMPNLVMNVDNSYKTVGSIALPGDWTWYDKHAETVIKAGESVEAIAVYVGDDKENYDSTELKITIYRAACSEGKTVKYTLKGVGTVSLAGTTYTRSDKKFTSVTIGDTVTIGDVRFKITSVGANAFSRYTVLKNVTIGKNVTSIGANAFLSCKNLRTVNIKSTKLTKVCTKAFYGTYSKITFVLPKGKAASYKKLIKNGSPSASAIYK